MTPQPDDENLDDLRLIDDFVPLARPGARDEPGQRRYVPSRKAREMFDDIEIRGLNVEEVAAKWDTTVRTVYDALERVREHLLASYRHQAAHPEEFAARQIARLEYQWQEAMRAWNFSRLDRRAIENLRETTEAVAGLVEQECRTKAGDVRFLQIGQRLMADVRSLIGEVHHVFLAPQEHNDDPSLTHEQRLAEICRIVGYDCERARAEADAESTGGEGSGELD